MEILEIITKRSSKQIRFYRKNKESLIKKFSSAINE